LIVFSKRIINRIVLLCESLSSNTTWNLCFSQFWSFEKTSGCFLVRSQIRRQHPIHILV
jgi:hypothetical protein